MERADPWARRTAQQPAGSERVICTQGHPGPPMPARPLSILSHSHCLSYRDLMMGDPEPPTMGHSTWTPAPILRAPSARQRGSVRKVLSPRPGSLFSHPLSTGLASIWCQAWAPEHHEDRRGRTGSSHPSPGAVTCPTRPHGTHTGVAASCGRRSHVHP